MDKEATELCRPLGVGGWLAACAGNGSSLLYSVPSLGQCQLQPNPSTDGPQPPNSTPATTLCPTALSQPGALTPCCPQNCPRVTCPAGWRTPTLGGPTGPSLKPSFVTAASYRLCRAQRGMKMRGPFVKASEEVQDSDSRVCHHQGLARCDRTCHMLWRASACLVPCPHPALSEF